MKRSFLTLLFISMLTCFPGQAINPQYQKFLGLKYRSPSYNFTPGSFQSITGKFNGKTVDTLTLFPYDGDWNDGEFVYEEWIIISKNGTVPSNIIHSYYPELVNEGDLDRNGCDDWGVLLTGFSSMWCTYNIYTCYKGKVDKLASTSWWLGNEEPLTTIARQGDRRGEVRVYEYKWNTQMTDIIKPCKTIRITKFLK